MYRRTYGQIYRQIRVNSNIQKYNNLCAIRSITTNINTNTKTNTNTNTIKSQDIDHQKILKEIGQYLWPKDSIEDKFRIVTAVGLMFSSKIINVQIPLLFKDIIDTMNITVSDNAIIIPSSIILSYGIVRAGAFACGELRNIVFANVSNKTIENISKTIFLQLFNMDLSYHLDRKTGEITKIIDRGTKGIRHILNSLLFNIAPTLFELSLVSGILLYNYDYRFSLLTISTIGLYGTYTILITKWRTNFFKTRIKYENDATSKAVDSLINYETVKYFNNENYEQKLYGKAVNKFQNEYLKVIKSLSLLNFGQNLIFSSSLTIAMFMVGNGIIDGNMTIGDMVMVNGLLFQLSMPLGFLGSIYRDTNQALIDTQNIFSLLQQKSNIQENINPLYISKSNIRFENVTFGYNTDNIILNNISFDVPEKSSVAFIGPSGCGKSTLIRLLYRFYDVDSGSIYIDDKNIKNLAIEEYRKNVSVIPQDTVLFNDTIYYNILYGNLNATYDEVIAASKMASIDDIIENLSDGYETIVGERGLKLSGGEKQRIAIARAFLNNGSILLCDEPTSALDINTETNIINSFNNLSLDVTKVFITHRLNTIKDFDQIMVLDNGKIVEGGSHDDLLKKGNMYARMWENQKY